MMAPAGSYETTPTRAEILALRRKIRLAEDGHRILKLKRDVLILELVKMTKVYRAASRDLAADYARAQNSIAIAQMMEGSLGIEIVSVAIEDTPEFTAGFRNVMGVFLPTFSPRNVRKELADRGYGLFGTSSVVDETAEHYEDLVGSVIRVAEIRSGMLRLAAEIDKTKRRVNALEKLVLPDLISRRDTILAIRDELEREEYTRLFWIKKKTGRYRSV
jgi:V/A-type H+-transporting ATPase subunit D